MYPGSRIAECVPDMHFAPRPQQAEPNTPKHPMHPASAGWPVAWNYTGCMGFMGFMGCMGYIAWSGPAWLDFYCCQLDKNTQKWQSCYRVCSAKRHWYQCTSRRPAITRGSFAPSVPHQHEEAQHAGSSTRGSAGAGVTQDHKNTRDHATRHDNEVRRPYGPLGL